MKPKREILTHDMKQSSSDIISSNNSIVGVLDFLGYEQLVQKKEVSRKVYDVLERMLGQKDDKLDIPSNIQQVINLIHVQIISDTLIFVLDLDDGCQSLGNFPIDIFLQLMSIFWIQLSIATGFFLQGGISLGQYYQRSLKKAKNQFIFSKAVVDAHHLSKEANGPLIMVDKTVWENVKARNDQLRCQVLRNTRGEYYLDIYGFWKGSVGVYKDEIRKVKEAFKDQIKLNISNSKILAKYFDFMRYHNSRLKQLAEQGIIEQIDDFLLEIPGKGFACKKY